jgi:putative peptidoglycan lipid II flippase
VLVGFMFAIPLPELLGLEQRWGAVGLTISSSLAAWTEFMLLRRVLSGRIGRTGLPGRFLGRLWVGATGAAIAALVVKLALAGQHPLVVALFSLGMYGIAYFAITAELGVPESRKMLNRVRWPSKG